MKVPSTSIPQHTSRASLVLRKKSLHTFWTGHVYDEANCYYTWYSLMLVVVIKYKPIFC
jgi:hypothetical protein